MKKLAIMMLVLFGLNIGIYIVTLFVPLEAAVSMYRMALLCNIGLFMPSLSLIHKENKKHKK